MKIAVVGDSHGDMDAMHKAVAAAPVVDSWLHTGDWSQDAKILSAASGRPVLAVAGNTDPWVGRARDEEIIEFAGYKIWLTHGHRYLACGKAGLARRAAEIGADIAIYGHTHVPESLYYNDILLVNPGSISRPRGGSQACFAVLSLDKELDVKFIHC